jgi:cell division protein FtsQ
VALRKGHFVTGPKRTPAGQTSFPTKRLIAGSVVAGVCLVAFLYAFHRLEQFLIRDPRFELIGSGESAGPKSLTVARASHASAPAIEAVFAEDFGRSVYLIPLADRRATLRTVDWVKDAAVARLWPNRLVVRITERTPVAFVTLGSGRVALIDEDGVILPAAKDRFTLPVLAGVRASDSIADRRECVQRAMRLTNELGEAAQKISEIDVSDRDNLKVSEPFEGRVVTLLLGDHGFAVRHQNFLNHFAEIKRKLPGAFTLDMRLEDRITVVE